MLTGMPADSIAEALAHLVACGAVKPPPFEDNPAPTAAPEAATEPEPASETDERSESETESDASEPTFRALFETRLHELPVEQRTVQARTAEEPELSAFCFDPVPGVIQSLLHNPKLGLSHARLIARHHRNPIGLEALAARAAFTNDLGVRRWLVRNPQLPTSLVRRLFQSRRLLEQFKLAQDRDLPEGTRRTMRELMRARFAHATAEERVEVIFNTEGRSLQSLSGMPVDGKTTALLCGRHYGSHLLIQNIARWSAAPPPLIAHLLKQESVRHQPTLRQLLQRHPNAPAGEH
jgi:hypothetical protein